MGIKTPVPILSYIFQKGRCKHCQEKISIFYPMFELLTGVLFVLGYLAYKEANLEQFKHKQDSWLYEKKHFTRQTKMSEDVFLSDTVIIKQQTK